MKVVYALRCPRTLEIRYIGEGTETRPYAHASLVRAGRQTASPRLTKWIASLFREGLEPVVDILQRDLSKKEAVDMEENLIARYGRSHLDENGTLLNVAQRGKAYDKSGNKNPFYGKKHTEATLEKMRIAKIGKPRSDELKAKLSAIAKSRPPISEETRQKKRASMLARWEQKRSAKLLSDV